MSEDRLDRIERISERVAKEQELFALEMRQLMKKTVQEIHQLRASQAETDKYIKNLGKTVGDLTDGWGKFILGLFLPSVEDCLKELGFEVISIDAPSRRRIGKGVCPPLLKKWTRERRDNWL